jgi:hypothetical protein
MADDKPKKIETRFGESAKPYRSKFRVKALQIVLEGAKPEDVFKVPIGDRTMDASAGDYVVELEDGRLELWKQDRFEREFELEPAPGRTIEVEL